MFAVLTYEREPLRLEDFPAMFLYWLQSAGGFATFGLILFLALGLPRWRKEDRASIPGWLATVFFGSTIVCACTYLAYYVTGLAMFAGSRGAPISPANWAILNYLLAAAGAAAIVAVGLPFLLGVLALSPRRIFALAKLSFKEAVRRRVLYAFSALLLIFLFGSWFIPSKPNDQVRTYVGIVFLTMNILLLLAALLVSAFSIPTDIKQQTIHTIVTKPVQRFEIVLGRFLGFLGLMTVVLVVMTGISLLYVLRGVHPEAAAESLKARVPHYGELLYENTDNERVGVNVGREWDYRSYIAKPSPGQEPNTARWDFRTLPAVLGGRADVRAEYTFDIYRTTKGDEGRDVYCTFRFFTWRFRKGNEDAYRKDLSEAQKVLPPGKELNAKKGELAEKYGYYEINAQPVSDYRTQSFVLPGGLFANALGADAGREKELAPGEVKKLLQMRVTCDSPTQYVGMAKRDFYLRLDESDGAERGGFALNFFKGTFGLWLQMALIIGISVCLSTYLNGVISLLITGVVFILGLFREFVQSVATGTNAGGGPVEAMVRISRRELSGVNLGDSTSIGDQIVSGSDTVFRWVVARVIDVLPDLDRFDLTALVAEGFNISGNQMLTLAVLLFGYLLPWAVLAYYLIRWREIANPN